MSVYNRKIKECPECKNWMDEIKSIDFSENGERYFYCEKCKISVAIDKRA